MKNIRINPFNGYFLLIVFLVLFGIFQSGRVYDDNRLILEDQSIHVYRVNCEAWVDTSLDEAVVIFYRGRPYRPDFDPTWETN